MVNRILPLVLLLVAPGAYPQEVQQPAQIPPTFVIRVSSLDTLFDDLKIVGGLFGQEDLGKKFDESIKKKLGPKGLQGIDAKQPLGVYGRVGADISDLSGVLMVPVTSAKQFKEMLEGLGWEVSDDKGNLYTVKQNLLPLDLQYRIVNNYAYVGLLGQDNLAVDRLLTPKAVFGARPSTSAVSLTLRLDQIPEAIRGMMLEAITEGVSKVEGKAGETKSEKELRLALTKEITRLLENVLKEGEEVSVTFDIDAKTKQINAELSLNGKPGSKLAENIAKLGQRKTLFAGVLDKEAAVNGLINVEVPGPLRDALTSMVQATMDKVVAETSDAAKKKQMGELFEALKPSLLAGDLDAGFSLRGPSKSKQFTLVAGFKLGQGDQLAATLIKMSKGLPEGEQNAIKLNAETIDNVPIHRIDLQAALDSTAKQLVGDHPLFVAFRDDAVFLAIGEDALSALKTAVTTPTAVMPPLQFDMRTSRFAAAMEKNEAAAKTAQGLLEAGDDARIEIRLEGGPALHIRFTMAISALKLFATEK